MGTLVFVVSLPPSLPGPFFPSLLMGELWSDSTCACLENVLILSVDVSFSVWDGVCFLLAFCLLYKGGGLWQHLDT